MSSSQSYRNIDFGVTELEERADALELLYDKLDKFSGYEEDADLPAEIMDFAPVVGYDRERLHEVTVGDLVDEVESRVTSEYARLSYITDIKDPASDLREVERVLEGIDETELEGLEEKVRGIRQYPGNREMVLGRRVPVNRLNRPNGYVQNPGKGDRIGFNKQELIHVHGLLTHVEPRVREEMDNSDEKLELDEYEILGIGPTSIHKSKTDHKAAVFAFLKGINSSIE